MQIYKDKRLAIQFFMQIKEQAKQVETPFHRQFTYHLYKMLYNQCSKEKA